MKFSVEIRRTSPYNELRIQDAEGYYLGVEDGKLITLTNPDGPGAFTLLVDEAIVDRLAPAPAPKTREELIGKIVERWIAWDQDDSGMLDAELIDALWKLTAIERPEAIDDDMAAALRADEQRDQAAASKARS